MDELDEFDEINNVVTEQDNDDSIITQDTNTQDTSQNIEDNQDIIPTLLQSKGISDPSRIKMDDGSGNIQEVPWDSLSREEQVNILSQNEAVSSSEYDLDDSEIELINTIRQSKMSPEEFMRYYASQAINQVNQNQSAPTYQYQVDDLDDDTLYAADLIARIGDENITDEEVAAMLENAKKDEAMFAKQVAAIRQEYKNIEDTNKQQEIDYQQQVRQEQFNQFANQIGDAILNLKEIGGYELNMDRDDQEEMYEFLTGTDAAGVNFFGKVLNDPKALTSMAWWLLHGQEAIDDINNYWSNEIAAVRKNSYEAGVRDAQQRLQMNNPKLAIQPKPNSSNAQVYYDDLD